MQIKTKMLPLVGAIAFALAGSVFAQEQVVTIGHVGPLTGPNAHIGKDNENGAKMAIDELNAKGTMIGGKKVKFVLDGEDDASDPKLATTVAQKLVDSHVNGVIGHMNSGTTIPASKIYFDAGIPQISPSATNPKYTQQGFNTAFRVVANDGQLGGTLGRYAVDKLKAKNIAVIDDRTAYGQGVAEEFSKGAKKDGADYLIIPQAFASQFGQLCRAQAITAHEFSVDTKLLHLTQHRATDCIHTTEENQVRLFGFDRCQNRVEVSCFIVGELG